VGFDAERLGARGNQPNLAGYHRLPRQAAFSLQDDQQLQAVLGGTVRHGVVQFGTLDA